MTHSQLKGERGEILDEPENWNLPQRSNPQTRTFLSKWLSQDILGDKTFHVGEPEIAAGIVVG